MSLHPDPAQLFPARRVARPAHTGRPGARPQARLSLVGAGPGAADLLTLRALQRLQEADIVLYDRLVDPEVLDLIPETTPQIAVGKELGNPHWTQGRIDALIGAKLAEGLHVLRLKSGDPSIFGRAGEEIAVARRAGALIEIVPGITAAAAGAASLCRPLTTRGLAQRLVLATATDCAGQLAATLAESFRPGTTLALYMGIGKLAEIEALLLSQGADPATAVAIVSHCSQARESRAVLGLAGLAAGAAAIPGLGNPAILLLSWGQTLADLAEDQGDLMGEDLLQQHLAASAP